MPDPSTKRPPKVAAILCLSGSLMGQLGQLAAQEPNTGQLSVRVADRTGAVIPKASIFLHRNAPAQNSLTLAGLTDGHGDLVLRLPEGGYDVIVTAPGFIAGVQTLPVFAGKTQKSRQKLRIVSCNFPGTVCDTFR